MTVEALLRQAEGLTPAERRELAERLMTADDTPADPPLTDAQLAEFRRRSAEMDANPGIGVPWEVVKANALKRARG